MPIPEFCDNYHLPPGEHECSLDEIEATFGSRNPQRQKVWSAFIACLARMNQLGLNPTAFLVDGSFVTGRDHPRDVDAAYLLSPATVSAAFANADDEDRQAILMFANTCNARSRSQALIRYLFGTHVFLAFDECSLGTLSGLFRAGIGMGGRLRPPDPARDPAWVVTPAEKGILRVQVR